MFARPTTRRWRTAPAYIVLVISLAATAVGAGAAARSAQQADARRFDEVIDHTAHAISSRMMEYVSALYGARALLEANGVQDRASFHRYVESLDLGLRAPGLQGLGFARRIPPEELAAHEAAVRAEGYPSYHVWPAGPRNLYTAIVYLEPFDQWNRRAFGYDMYSEPVRRAAMDLAWITDKPVASGVVTLVQENDASPKQPGFLLYLPLFSNGAERQILGWVYAPFRTHDLFRGILGHPGDAQPQTDAIDIEVYDGLQLEPAANLYDRNAVPDIGDGERVAGLQRAVVLEVAGRSWTVLFTAHEEFLHGSARSGAAWVFVLGILASALLFAIVQFQIRGRSEAEERERRQKFLAEAGGLLSQSLDSEQTLSQVAGICAQSLADWCTVHLLLDGDLRAVALAHRDPDRVHWAREIGGWFPLGAAVAHQLEAVIHSGAPVLASDVQEGAAEAPGPGPEERERPRAAQIASYICVPLVARGQAIGALTLISSVPGRYNADDLATAQGVAHLAAAAVDNARQYQRAQEAARIRDEFLSVASHELKTPLTSMVLKLAALRRLASSDAPDVPERRARAYEVLDRQTKRLVRLVDGLLDITRLAAGRLRLELSEVDLAEVARDAASAAREEVTLADCALELDAPAAVVGCWDRMRVEQILSSLLSNAVKYGRGRPIHLSVRAAEGKAQVVVRDQGIGLAPEDLKRVFERFERAVPAANYGGLGLGLYIAKQIVEAMGGHISVESKAGQGSTFEVELPLSGPQAATAPGGAVAAASAPQRPPAPGRATARAGSAEPPRP